MQGVSAGFVNNDSDHHGENKIGTASKPTANSANATPRHEFFRQRVAHHAPMTLEKVSALAPSTSTSRRVQSVSWASAAAPLANAMINEKLKRRRDILRRGRELQTIKALRGVPICVGENLKIIVAGNGAGNRLPAIRISQI